MKKFKVSNKHTNQNKRNPMESLELKDKIMENLNFLKEFKYWN